MTNEEILEKYDSLSIEQLQKEIKTLDLRQNAIKILINAFYGAFGNKYFYFSDLDIAQSITLQGQDLIKFSVKAMNHFFRNKWHLDKELHAKLGISHLNVKQITDDAVLYVDTDSNYVWFHPALLSVEGLPEMTDDETIKFLLIIDEFGIKPYLKKAFEKYASVYNTENRQDFELENISIEAVWLAKKNYILNIVYEDNEHRDLLPLEKRYKVIKGLENVKGSYPIWARTKLGLLDDIILKKGRNLRIEEDLVPALKEIRDEYMTLPIDQISFNFNLNEFDKYIIDLETLKFTKGMGPTPRGAAYHNYMILTTRNEKYTTILSGSKVKMYHCGTENNPNNFDVFCYQPGEFPAEFAPSIDKKHQFFRLIVEPMNRFLEAYGWMLLDNNLNRQVEVIKTRTKKEIKPEDFYPYYAIDFVKLDYTEVPRKFDKYLENPGTDIEPDDFAEYLSYISKYDLNTRIVPKFELQKFIKKRKKKLEGPAEITPVSVEAEIEGQADREQMNQTADEGEE